MRKDSPGITDITYVTDTSHFHEFNQLSEVPALVSLALFDQIKM